MKYVTEKDLRDWFKEMEHKYCNAPAFNNLRYVENAMFDTVVSPWENLTFRETEDIEKEKE